MCSPQLLIFCFHTFLLSFTIEIKGYLLAKSITSSTFLHQSIQVMHSSCTNQNDTICTKISIRTKTTSISLSSVCVLCNNDRHDNTLQLPIAIPNEYVCYPGYWNRRPIFIKSAKLSIYTDNEHISYDLNVPPPYSRLPCLEFQGPVSTSMYHKMRFWMSQSRLLIRSNLVVYPYIISDGIFVTKFKMGLYIPQPHVTQNNYYNKFVRQNSDKFTLSMWLNIHESCQFPYCNILAYLNNTNDAFKSPVLLLTRSGKFHVQGNTKELTEDIAYLTNYRLPLHQWIRIIFSVNPYEWSLTLVNENGSIVGETRSSKFRDRVRVDFMKYYGVVGGSNHYSGVVGIVGNVYMFAGRNIDHREVMKSNKNNSEIPTESLQMAELMKDAECDSVVHEMKYYYQRVLRRVERNICKTRKLFDKSNNVYKNEFCDLKIGSLIRPNTYRYVKKLVNDRYRSTDQMDFQSIQHNISQYLVDRVWTKLKIVGLKWNYPIIKYLKSSHCLHNSEADYLLSAGYYYGIGSMEINTTKSRLYLIKAINNSDHYPSLLALANLYYLQDGKTTLPSVYIQYAASLARNNFESQDPSHMFNDKIRLINEETVKEHTDEDGDLFHWIKHQAESGVPWAKEKLGKMLYWGSNGIRRNVDKAISYLKQAAEDPSANAGNHFDYGVILIKQKNDAQIEIGRQELEKAGSKDPRALTALGWLHETKYNDRNKAFSMYRQAADLGNPDSQYNMGIYYNDGVSGVVRRDKVKAFYLFQKAAIQGQLHSGFLYAQYLYTGVGSEIDRNYKNAFLWGRFVAEQSHALGPHLSEGVRAFRNHKMSLAMMYYILVAYTGLELAQFNMAFLSEEHESLVKKFVQHESTWYHYNAATQRPEHEIHSFSLIKMGDNYWYGCNGYRNISKAIDYYIRAAKKGEAQAYFNLAYIVEKHEEVEVNENKFNQIIHLPDKNQYSTSVNDWRIQISFILYQKCQLYSLHQGYIACLLAQHRLKFIIWMNQSIWILKLFALLVMAIVIIYRGWCFWLSRYSSTPQVINQLSINPV